MSGHTPKMQINPVTTSAPRRYWLSVSVISTRVVVLLFFSYGHVFIVSPPDRRDWQTHAACSPGQRRRSCVRMIVSATLWPMLAPTFTEKR